MIKLTMRHFTENLDLFNIPTTGTIIGTSYEKLNQELGLETFQSR